MALGTDVAGAPSVDREIGSHVPALTVCAMNVVSGGTATTLKLSLLVSLSLSALFGSVHHQPSSVSLKPSPSESASFFTTPPAALTVTVAELFAELGSTEDVPTDTVLLTDPLAAVSFTTRVRPTLAPLARATYTPKSIGGEPSYITGLIDTLLERGLQDEVPNVKVRAGKGAGACEVPRGVLFHEYTVGDDGRIVGANCIIPTGQNLANIEADMRALVPRILDKAQDQIRLMLEISH
jgi:hypothetical protein